MLIICPLDSGTGAHIEKLAKAAGVTVIDYDRLTLGGTRGYYVSFDNVRVGTVMGDGFTACVKAWHVKDPNVIVMKGAPTDNNATLFAQGYLGVLNPLFTAWHVQGHQQPARLLGPADDAERIPAAVHRAQGHQRGADPERRERRGGHPLPAGPGRQAGAPSLLTGQDASLAGLQNILGGYQCGTVYKPIYLEAGATAAPARCTCAPGRPRPPRSSTARSMDTTASVSVPSVLATPKWVTTANMNDDRDRGQVRPGCRALRRAVRGPRARPPGSPDDDDARSGSPRS